MTIDHRYSRDPGDVKVIIAAQQSRTAEVIAQRRLNKMKATAKANQAEAEKQKAIEDARVKFNPRTQPRDETGRYKQILARLKLNLGPESTLDLAKQIEAGEVAQVAGDYNKMREAGANIVERIEKIDEGALPRGNKENLRDSARELGELMAYLPMPQGDASAKVRFSDLPPAAKDFMRHIVDEMIKHLGQSKAAPFIHDLESFMSGGQRMDADEMASNLNKCMKILH